MPRFAMSQPRLASPAPPGLAQPIRFLPRPCLPYPACQAVPLYAPPSVPAAPRLPCYCLDSPRLFLPTSPFLVMPRLPGYALSCHTKFGLAVPALPYLALPSQSLSTMPCLPCHPSHAVACLVWPNQTCLSSPSHNLFSNAIHALPAVSVNSL